MAHILQVRKLRLRKACLHDTTPHQSAAKSCTKTISLQSPHFEPLTHGWVWNERDFQDEQRHFKMRPSQEPEIDSLHKNLRDLREIRYSLLDAV